MRNIIDILRPLNRNQAVFSYVFLSSFGLISLLIQIVASIHFDAKFAYLSSGLSDWSRLAGIDKVTSLTQYIIAVTFLFIHYSIPVGLKRFFPEKMSENLSERELFTFISVFIFSLGLNAIVFAKDFYAYGLLAAFFVWFLTTAFFYLYFLPSERVVFSNRAFSILVLAVSVQYCLIFIPLIINPIVVENDYINIPERTILKSGTTVDNIDYINSHNLAGLGIHDARVDGGNNVLNENKSSVNLKNCEFVYNLLSRLNYVNKYKYNCDVTSNRFYLTGSMDNTDYQAIINLRLDNESVLKLTKLYVESNPISKSMKVYTDEEKDFVSRNSIEIKHQMSAGWFFYHHNYFFGPMHAIHLGASPNSMPMIYGWLNTVTVGSLLDKLGMMNYQGYFKVYFSMYLAYYLVFLLGVWAIFRKPMLVFYAATLSLCAISLLGIEYIRLAPGFNPLRHFFDVPVFFFFYKYLSKRKLIFLLLACMIALLGIAWSTDFGLFLAISIGAATLVDGCVNKVRYKKVLFIGGLTILLSLLIYKYPMPGHNPIGLYMYFVGGNAAVSKSLVMFIAVLISLLLAGYILIRQELHFKILTLAMMLYSIQSLLYFVWDTSEFHHILGVAPIHILFLLAIFHGLIERADGHYKVTPDNKGLLSILFISYISSTLLFCMSANQYSKIDGFHKIYKWSFAAADLQSTGDPSLFYEASKLIEKYSANDKGIYIISKYDHILPVLADKYSLMPFLELPTNLVSKTQILLVRDTVLKNKPNYIYVDTDISRNLNSEIAIKADPVSTLLGLHDESYWRVMVMQQLRDVYSEVAVNYQLCMPGKLISVYCLKH